MQLETYINLGVLGAADALFTYDWQEAQPQTDSQPELKRCAVLTGLKIKVNTDGEWLDVTITSFNEDELQEVLDESL